MLMEIWKPIENYPNYEVSNLGRVRRINHTDSNGIVKLGKIKAQNYDGKGNYLHVCLCNKDGSKTINVHRLVAKAFIPNPNNLPEVNHIDENKANNSATNLEWCDHTYNNNYGSKATASIGTKNSQNKLSEEEIKFIFSNHPVNGGKISNSTLSKMFGISQSHISSIAYGRRWGWLNDLCT